MLVMLSFFVFVFFIFIFYLSGLNFSTRGIFSGVGYSVLVNIFLMSMPGVLYVSLLGVDNWRYVGITEATKSIVLYSYLYSLIVAALVVYVYGRFIGDISVQLSDDGSLENKKRKILFFSVLFVFFYTALRLVYLHPAPPLRVLFTDGFLAAMSRRYEYQTGDAIRRIPYLSNIFDGLLIVSIYYISLWQIAYKKEHRKFKSISLFVLTLVVSFYNFAYDLQKAPFLIFIISLLYFSFLLFHFRVVYLVIIASGLVAFLVYVSYYMTGNFYFEGSLLERIIVGQNQGLYLIFQYIQPSLKYALFGLPFASLFDLSQINADVEIIPYVYNNSEHIVNVNTYYLAQAWSMFGEFGVLISPFIVWFVVCIYNHFIIRAFPKNFLINAAFSFAFLTMIPLNMSFTFFLYPKNMFISFIPVVLIFYLMQKISLKKH